MIHIINRVLYEVRMWKFICRGIRETVEKNGERAISAAVENCQGNLSTVGNSKNQDHESKRENPEKPGDNKNNSWRPQIRLHTILEAVGLSTAIWFGTYSSHPLCWRKHVHSIACNNNVGSEKNPRPEHTCRYKGLVHLIAGTASAQPLANKTEGPTVTINDNNPENNDNSSAFTPKDELQEAILQLKATAGYIDNKLGVMCMEKGWYTEAVDYFLYGWKFGDVSACYNLAVCYERGLGTQPDQQQAMQYYKEASVLDHPTAKYNLGVFYAQGRGGLPVDYTKARELFQDAALQGVMEAKAALDLEIENSSSDSEEDCKEDEEQEECNNEEDTSWHLPSLKSLVL